MERRAIFGPLFTTFSTCDRSIGRPTIENRLTHPLKGKEGSPWHALGFFSRHLTSRHSAQREQCGRLTNQRKRTWPRSVLVRFVERKWSLLRRSLPRRAIQFYLASRASTSPRKRATSTTLSPPPTAIGDPMNRNLSNSPSRSPRVSRWRDRSPSTPTAANRAFTRTGLIPRALFFGDARRAPKLETEKSFRSGESCAKDSAAGASRSHRFSDTFGDDSIDAQFGITIRRETSRICIYIGLFAYIEEEEICW